METELRTLTLDQTAKLLNCHRQTLVALVKRGDLPGRKAGKAYVFIEDDVAAYIRGELPQNRKTNSKTTKQRREQWAYTQEAKAKRGGAISSIHVRESAFAKALGLQTESLRTSS